MWMLVIAIVILLGVIAKLRSDLCDARWIIYRLLFMQVMQGKRGEEFWEAPEPREITAYVEGQITLHELFRKIEEKHR